MALRTYKARASLRVISQSQLPWYCRKLTNFQQFCLKRSKGCPKFIYLIPTLNLYGERSYHDIKVQAQSLKNIFSNYLFRTRPLNFLIFFSIVFLSISISLFFFIFSSYYLNSLCLSSNISLIFLYIPKLLNIYQMFS